MLSINLELRTFYDDPAKDAVILKLIRILGKQLLTQTSLLQNADDFPAELKIEAGDFLSRGQEVLLFDGDGLELDSEVIEEMSNAVRPLARLDVNARKKPIEEDIDALVDKLEE